MEEEGENARTGGGVATGFCSGSKGEQDGETLWKSWRMGNVNARGVGETMSTVGMNGTSVVTSRPVNVVVASAVRGHVCSRLEG